jgi:hypothetical protein
MIGEYWWPKLDMPMDNATRRRFTRVGNYAGHVIFSREDSAQAVHSRAAHQEPVAQRACSYDKLSGYAPPLDTIFGTE